MSNVNEPSNDEVLTEPGADSAAGPQGQAEASQASAEQIARDKPEEGEEGPAEGNDAWGEGVSLTFDDEPPKAAVQAEETAAQAASQAPAEPKGEDRRSSYRLNKVLGASLTSLGGTTQAARLFVIDISSSGFRATDHQPHPEEQYDITVVLSKEGAPFRSRMRVVWTKELTVSGMFQMGCEFVDPAPEELAKLEAFIDKERNKVEPAKPPMDLGRPWTMIR